MAALSAAWALSLTPELRRRYRITVYQQGWRLGGKGASGRNPKHHQRIEEHGLHVWMGFYENAFRVMRDVYARFGALRPEAEFTSWKDAFHPHHDILLQEALRDAQGRHLGWSPWPIHFPHDSSEPGDAELLPTPLQFLWRLVQWAMGRLEVSGLSLGDGEPLRALQARLTDWAPDRLTDAVRAVREATRPLETAWERFELAPHLVAPDRLAVPRVAGTPGVDTEDARAGFLHLAGALLRGEAAELARPEGPLAEALEWVLEEAMRWSAEAQAARLGRTDAQGLAERRDALLVELACALSLGLVRHGLWREDADFTQLDDLDFRAWLKALGASELASDSVLVTALYDLVFSTGDTVAAGSGLLRLLRMVLTYNGAVFYKMQAGMGDVVFAPLYEVLRERGVRFEFFHKVERLESADGKQVTDVRVKRQVRLKAPQEEYQPLLSVGRLRCWPSVPLVEQLEHGELLPDGGCRLEAFFEDTPQGWPSELRHLRRGEDFDDVVLGISLAALPALLGETLARQSEPLARTLQQKTVATQALQLWMKPSLAGLGYTGPSPVATAYAKPLDTWADMTQTLAREAWGGGADGQGRPGSVHYFCARLEEDPVERPFGPEQQEKATAYVRRTAEGWLGAHIAHLWSTCGDGALWGQLWGGDGAPGLAGQYWRANVHPSERYVLSTAGSTRLRLGPDEAGFLNLFLAGDWTRTGLNGGFIEAATISGLQAARALSGERMVIPGEGPARGAPAPRPAPAPVEDAALPAYVVRGGDVSLRGPYRQQGCRLYTFALPTRCEPLMRLVDQALNLGPPERRRVHYRPLAPVVLVQWADIARLSSLHPEDRRKGWSRERDVSFWVPLMAGRLTRDGRFEPERLAFYLPYVFVDNASAMAIGREVHGFPKASAGLHSPVEGQRALFTATTQVLPRFSPDTHAVDREVLRIWEEGGAPLSTGRATGVGGFLDVLRTLLATLRLGSCQGFDWRVLWEQLTGGQPDQVSLVFLKQFRDVEDTGRACYQAVTEVPTRVEALRGWGPLPGRFRAQLGAFASHPLARELGVGPQPLDVALATWCDVDFLLENGRVVQSFAPARPIPSPGHPG